MDEYNIYEAIYKRLDNSVAELTYQIFFDDDQLCVYSAHIAELILRIAVEIESLAVGLYRKEGGTKTIISYGSALEYLVPRLNLKDTKVLVDASHTHFSPQNRVLIPFSANWDKENGWKYAYEVIKHDKLNDKYQSIKQYGTVKILLDILSALFVLNCYYTSIVRGANGFAAFDRHKQTESNLFAVLQKWNDGYAITVKAKHTGRATLPEDLAATINAITQ